MNYVLKLCFRSRAWILALILISPSMCCYAQSAFIEVPDVTGQGDTFSYEPFTLEIFGNNQSIRYQQVFGADAFSAIGVEGGIITDIYFRGEPGVRGFAAVLPSVEMLLSTTPRNPDQLSLSFSDNLGVNTATVHFRSPLTLTGSGSGVDVRFTLPTPYYYNPSDGNLLLEVRNYARIENPNPVNTVHALDAEDTFGDSVSRLFSFDVNATTGTADSLGLLTYFQVTPVPEPSTFALLLLGFGMLAFIARKKSLRNARVGARFQQGCNSR